MDWLEIKETIKDVVKVLIVIIIILFILQYIVSLTKVVGSSMSPTLKDEELLIVNKFSYRFGDIKREDIVSLRYADTKYLIKRIIGLPGDYVYIKDNKLYINDKLYVENYIADNLVYNDFDLNDLGFNVIPKDMYLVLGDNRPDSLDSRKIGLIKRKDIIGKIAFRFWPLNRVSFI